MFKNFIHRDIRPDNILIDKDYRAKIADMGISRLLIDHNAKDLSKIGCYHYMPPEFYSKNYTNKLDVYTFGLTLNELYKGSHDLAITTSDKRVKIEYKAIFFYFLVKLCTKNDVNDRLTSKSVAKILRFFHDRIAPTISLMGVLSNNSNDTFNMLYQDAYKEYKNS